jgi:hypothetical protein
MSTGIIVTIYVLWVILIVFLGEKWIREIIKDKGGFTDYIFPTIAIIMGILAPFKFLEYLLGFIGFSLGISLLLLIIYLPLRFFGFFNNEEESEEKKGE